MPLRLSTIFDEKFTNRIRIYEITKKFSIELLIRRCRIVKWKGFTSKRKRKKSRKSKRWDFCRTSGSWSRYEWSHHKSVGCRKSCLMTKHFWARYLATMNAFNVKQIANSANSYHGFSTHFDDKINWSGREGNRFTFLSLKAWLYFSRLVFLESWNEKNWVSSVIKIDP